MAARGLNRVMIIGNLGQAPEVRFMPNGSAVANFTIATSESWKDKQTGEQKEKTEWHRIVMYQRLAEIAGEYLQKGSKVYVEGKLQTRKWTNQQGADQYTTEIVANEMQMLDSRNQNPSTPTFENRQNPPNVAPQSQHAPAQHQPQHAPAQHQPQHAPAQQKPYSPQSSQPAQQRGFQQNQSTKVNPAEPSIDFDDDIPF